MSSNVEVYKSKFTELAGKGILCFDGITGPEGLNLSQEEIAGLRKEGLWVFPNNDPTYKESDAIPCFVDWSKPYFYDYDRPPFDTIDAIIFYAEGVLDEEPEGTNFAQRLYAIATRANKNKK